jgi:acetoin utilization deacetylase AcuC-like enzyme
MSKTALVFSTIYYKHNPGRNHPESAKRLGMIVSELKKSRLSKSKNWLFVKPREASLAEITLVHDLQYAKFIEFVCKSGGGLLNDGDTVVSRESFTVALYAVGGTLMALDLVMNKRFENAFALVRPPGHHSESSRAMGFCIFNNVAIAAKYLLEKWGLKKVAIIDIDAHHGNGTQKTFYETSQVLYMSIHQDPRGFPGTGFCEEVGRGNGLGYTVNIPLPFKTNDHIYLNALNEIVIPVIYAYKPEFLLISAGLDGHYTDPVGNLSLSMLCFQKIYDKIVEMASKTCNGRLVSVLEGGYSLSFVGKIAVVITAKMSNTPCNVSDKICETNVSVRRRGKRMIKLVKRVQRDFWKLD